MRIDSRLLLAFLAGAIGLLAGCNKVPSVDSVVLQDNDLNAVIGTGAAGTMVVAEIRQRRLEAAPLDGATGLDGHRFAIGSTVSEWQPLCGGALGACPVVDGDGDWAITGPDGQGLDAVRSFAMTVAGGCATSGCDGMLTELRLRALDLKSLELTDQVAPIALGGLNVVHPASGSFAYTEARVVNAKSVTTSIADGPDDNRNQTFPTTSQDMGEAWIDGLADGASVTFRRNPVHPELAAAQVWVGAPFSVNGNREFGNVVGMVAAYKPGYALFAASSRVRQCPPTNPGHACPDITVQVGGHVHKRFDFAIGVELCNICPAYYVPGFCETCLASSLGCTTDDVPCLP